MRNAGHIDMVSAILAVLMTAGLLTGCEKGETMEGDRNGKDTAAGCGLPLSDKELRKTLSPEQYRVMRQDGTERPFMNEYWDNEEPGIYVDAITGAPLFSSTDKFASGTGWPSFIRPIDAGNVVELPDASHGMVRTEVRSKKGDSHLGHVFQDGPGPAGSRYCINSAALRFVPRDEMEEEGYGEYLYLFNKEGAGK